jgi:hypothetical protein
MTDTELGICKFAYEKYKKYGSYEDKDNQIYDILKPHIPFSHKLKREIWEVAFWQLKKELQGDADNMKYEDEIVISRTKQIALNKFFEMLKEVDLTIDEYIKQKEEEKI